MWGACPTCYTEQQFATIEWAYVGISAMLPVG